MALAIAIALVWSATAGTKLSAAESATESATLSVTESVGLTSREQLRHADAIRTFGDTPSLDATADWQPILRVAADWRSDLSQLRMSLENGDRLAQNGPQGTDSLKDNSAASEEVSAGKPQRDRCYANSPLSTLQASIGPPTGAFPEDVAAQCRASTPAMQDPRMFDGWSGFEKHWSATCMHHRPLYFEEVNAERYGYTPSYCIQPLVSAGHFFATIPTLPYQMFAQPPCQCTYTLGHYRPGSCVPYRNSRWPWRCGAGIAEAAVGVALVALIP